MRLNLLKNFYGNHVFASLCLALVIAMGGASYLSMPVEQNPSVNFNWVLVITPYPGAAPTDIEKSITTPVEDALRKLSDVRFVRSTSRDSLSTVLLRFRQISSDEYDDHMVDLRRELQTIKQDLPHEAQEPQIIEVTSSNSVPSATIVLVGPSDGTHLREYAKKITEDIERMPEVEDVRPVGFREQELQILFKPELLNSYGVNPMDVVDTIQANMQDLAAGSLNIAGQRWTLRWEGAIADPSYVATIPLLTSRGEIPLSTVADVQWGLEKAKEKVHFQGAPAVMLSILKKENTHVLNLIDQVEEYVEVFNLTNAGTGLKLVSISDLRDTTESAIAVMTNNAIVGLLLVLLTTWIFLGIGMSILISIGIPFSLAGAFWCLNLMGFTLNISVLLGVVIALGMLVDDAVVVMEAIYFHLRRTTDPLQALAASLKETVLPVTTSVLTTVCAFLPLILLPGILGDFMQVVPIVVTLALVISLLEAFWLLPAHVFSYWNRIGSVEEKVKVGWRARLNANIRRNYIRNLIKILRKPKKAFLGLGALVAGIALCVSFGAIRVDFFAGDTLRFFYINVEMPVTSEFEETLAFAEDIEKRITTVLRPEDVRNLVTYSGMKVTETEVLQGEHLGQIFVSLTTDSPRLRSVDTLIDEMRAVLPVDGAGKVDFMPMRDGPPPAAAINISVRGKDFPIIQPAVADLKSILEEIEGTRAINDDAVFGQDLLIVHPDLSAIHRVGLTPNWIMQTVRLLVDGAIVGDVNEKGEKLNLRVMASKQNYREVEEVLQQTLFLPEGDAVSLGSLVKLKREKGPSAIRHYDFRRAITVNADLDKMKNNTLSANKEVQAKWEEIQDRHPGIDLIFSGELDDIEESLNALPFLFLLGLGLIYLVLGTQFRSYFQPLLIIATIPMAFIGVALGLIVSGYALSLYTLYGVVALSGISVNAAIVLISAANERIRQGMPVLLAILFAARRRVVPIIITTTTTIAGLLSLALGLGGESQMWGPVATSIVFGLFFSTLLTLFVLPLMFASVMGGLKKTN